MSGIAFADNDKPIQIGQLPTKAQTFLSTYFKSSKVALASGDWTEVSCKVNGVPSAIVPQGIKSYVQSNYPDARILSIERDRSNYEVKLSNRWEITFDSQMRVIDIDD